MNAERIKRQIIRHEGKRISNNRHMLYKCSAGKWTLGYGRNVESRGLSEDEALMLLENDIEDACIDLADIFTQFVAFPENIQLVLVDMRLNLGPGGFRNFKRMISAVKAKDWKQMKVEMIDSKWYADVGQRAINLVKMVDEVIA